MDRRTLLAIILSTAVVLIFNIFILPKPERRAPGAGPGVADSAAVGEVPTASTHELTNPPSEADVAATAPRSAMPVGATLADADSVEHRITVQTELYRAEFSNRGGQVVSFELLQFDTPTGDPVQLVAGPGELGLRVSGDAGLTDLQNLLFRMREEPGPDGARRVIFDAGGDGAPHVMKTFTLPRDGYLIDLQVEIDGMPASSSYQVGWDNGVPRSEANDKQYKMSAGAIVLLGKSRETIHAGSFKKESVKEIEGNVRWAGARNKYFMAVVIPPPETSSQVLAVGDAKKELAGSWIVMPMFQGAARTDFKVYLGPIDYDGLKKTGYDLEKAVDLGWRVVEPLSKLLLWAMVAMYKIIPNYGIVIIILSVITKLIFYPLTKSSVKSMRAMQKLQPELTALREKYKNDPQKMNAEMMSLYKKMGVNPLGGCLPIVVQMPVFIALYRVLANSIAMRHADFFLWMNDLSSPDTIAVVAGFSIHVLPILLFGVTVLQQLWTPVGDSRQKMMGYMMPLVTLFIFYSFPAGLNLYWTVNSIMTAAQQWQIHREDPMHPAPAKT